MSVSRRALPPHLGQVVLTKLSSALEGRALFPRDGHVVRDLDRQVLIGDADGPALRAVDDRDGRSPVPLAGDSPVAEAEGRAPAADAFLFGVGRHSFHGLFAPQPGERAGVLEAAVALEGLPFLGLFLGPFLGDDDGLYRKPVFFGEIVIALVVGRNGHDGPRPVIHEDIVRDPDGDGLAREGIDGPGPRVDAFLLVVPEIPFGPGVGDGLGDPGLGLLPARGGGDEIRRHGVLGREDQEGRSVDRVDPGREDLDRPRQGRHREVDHGAPCSCRSSSSA